jgi:hypothetical protein
MFKPEFGKQVDAGVMKGSTLVIGSHGAGLSPHIGMDLMILNTGMQRLGFYKTQKISSVIINDSLTLPGAELGAISMPAELWFSEKNKMTFLLVRSGVSGSMRAFCDELIEFIQKTGFANVALLTATMSPIKRERDSNRQIPEVFGYLNNCLLKQQGNYYEEKGIRKFGSWIQDVKKRPHQELAELGAAGWAGRLMKAFNRVDIPVAMFVIFCTGGVDFVGGYTYFEFLQQNIFGSAADTLGVKFGKLDLNAGKLTDGEQVHEHIFKSGDIKTPQGW